MILLARPVRLLDLGDTDWVTVAGGNAAIFAGERSQSRKWARAIHANYRVDGIVYTSSVNPAGRAVALWERAEDAMPSRADAFPLRTLVNEVENAADRIRYGVSWDEADQPDSRCSKQPVGICRRSQLRTTTSKMQLTSAETEP